MDRGIIREYYLIIKNKILQARFESALMSADKLLHNFPNDYFGYYYKGVCFFALEKYQDSMKNYVKALELNPGFDKAYFNLGVCYYILRKYDYALINIAKALIIFTKQKELDKKQRCMEAIKYIESERRM